MDQPSPYVCRWRASIHMGGLMRTNIDIDDDLIAEAMAATGLATKKATVEEALRRLDALADMAGLGWDGDLDAMREGRMPDSQP